VKDEPSKQVEEHTRIGREDQAIASQVSDARSPFPLLKKIMLVVHIEINR